ncbi:hypothetical protein ABMB44_13440 [Levilactobacillus brevis]
MRPFIIKALVIKTPADHTASVNFTRSVSTDAVTGEKTYGAWSAEQSFDAVKSPEAV